MSLALWFGIGIHEALAHYYGNVGFSRNMDYIDVWYKYCDEDDYSKVLNTRPDPDSPDVSVLVSARLLGATMLSGYHEYWGGDPNWDVVYTERPFQVEIPDPQDESVTLGIFTSTLDGVYRNARSGRLRLMEHKTAQQLDYSWLQMDNQGGAYWAFASQILRDQGIISKNDVIEGIDYNFLRKAMPDTRPVGPDGFRRNKPGKAEYSAALISRRLLDPTGKMPSLADMMAMAGAAGMNVLGPISKVQPSPLFGREFIRRTRRERFTQIRRIADELIALQPFRDGEFRVTKNPTKDCKWDCSFFQMCQLHELGGDDWKEYKEGVFIVEDPYNRYRLRKSA